MKANELRIGNYLCDSNGAVIIVTAEMILHIDRTISFNPPTPIPLTPEILENAGFRKEVYGGFDDRDFCRWHIGYNIYVYNDMHTYLQDGKNIVEHIKYVHQIQNLYFAFTGTELEINLNP